MNIRLLGSVLNVGVVITIIVGVIKLATASKRGYGKGYKIKTIAGSAFLALAFLVIGSMISDEMDQSAVYIKAQHPVDVSDITYGQVIDSLCENQEWNRATSEVTTSGRAIVQMDADCIYGGEKHRITIQFNYGVQEFVLIDEETPFEITFVGFDGVQNVQVSDMEDVVYAMFLQYAERKGIELDESVKYSILYSAGQ